MLRSLIISILDVNEIRGQGGNYEMSPDEVRQLVMCQHHAEPV
jgi:hypothetical protein